MPIFCLVTNFGCFIVRKYVNWKKGEICRKWNKKTIFLTMLAPLAALLLRFILNGEGLVRAGKGVARE